MDTINKLSAEEFREKVRRARGMTPDEKLAECCRLTDLAIEAMKAEIRADYPLASEQQVDEILTLRFQVLRFAKGKVPGGVPEESSSPGN